MRESVQGNFTCRNIFPSPCGSLAAGLTLQIDLQNMQYVAGWLQTMGISNIRTLLGALSFDIRKSNPTLVAWNVDILPELEIIRNGLYITAAAGTQFIFLPGIGFGKLRVTPVTYFKVYGSTMQNTDLAFLSSLECPGRGIYGGGLSTLTSLKGLERVVDGVPAEDLSFCFLSTHSIISNASALATYARCGADQRPDTRNSRPCLTLPCGYISSWSALCNYISRGTCT
jgi:hypothetical protein